MLDRAYPFLNETTMSRYVNDSTAALLKIHEYLLGRPVQDPAQTALVLLDESEVAPYAPPLGDS